MRKKKSLPELEFRKAAKIDHSYLYVIGTYSILKRWLHDGIDTYYIDLSQLRSQLADTSNLYTWLSKQKGLFMPNIMYLYTINEIISQNFHLPVEKFVLSFL